MSWPTKANRAVKVKQATEWWVTHKGLMCWLVRYAPLRWALNYSDTLKIAVRTTHPVTKARITRSVTFRPRMQTPFSLGVFRARDHVRQSLGTPDSFTAGNEPLTLELTEVS